MSIIQYKKGFTHSGKFHADDVFSSAFLRILNPDIEIERGNAVPEDFDGIVYDIGGGSFDHHQKDKRLREDEEHTPYAAFGLLWEKFGGLLFDEEEVAHFDEKFIAPLDLSDNTGCSHPLAFAVEEFNPVWDDEDTDPNDRFFEAVDMAQKILEYKFQRIQASQRAKGLVMSAMEKWPGKILVLERAMPWKKFVKDTEYLYVIYPSNRGGYSIQAVPDENAEEEQALKRPFPEAWRGASTEELRQESGVDTARFCHTSGFLAAAEDLDGALEMAKKAIG